MTNTNYPVANEVEKSSRRRLRPPFALPRAARPQSQPHSRVISEARSLMASEVRRAEALLVTESTRRKVEVARQEAYCISASMLSTLIAALKPDATPSESRVAYNALETLFTAAGWEVIGKFGPANPAYIRSREPLRKLADLMECCPPGGQANQSFKALVDVIDDMRHTAIENQDRAAHNKIPPPVLAYAVF